MILLAQLWLCDEAHARVRAMRRSLALLVLCAFGVAGCGGGGGGGGGSDSDQIKAAIRDAYGAFAKEDADTFCGHLTKDFRGDFEDNYGPCQDSTLIGIVSDLDESDRKLLESPKIGALHIAKDGKSAYPDVNGDGLEMEKQGGKWKLDDFDLPGS